jgi:hypothetical protein
MAYNRADGYVKECMLLHLFLIPLKKEKWFITAIADRIAHIFSIATSVLPNTQGSNARVQRGRVRSYDES